jgi:GAF domain-containing protein
MNIHDVSKLDKDDEVSKILEPQFVKSLLTIPLFRNDKLFGFLGFDSVKEKHNYTRFEQTVLTEYSKLLIDLLERLKIDTN